MDQPLKRIEHLSKVTLELQLGTASDRWDPTQESFRHEFIYGIGSGGLSPLEFQLAGMGEGDETVMHLQAEDLCRCFGPGPMSADPQIPAGNAASLRARVIAVRPADSREVVKAMAAMAACSGCGGDCCGHDH